MRCRLVHHFLHISLLCLIHKLHLYHNNFFIQMDHRFVSVLATSIYVYWFFCYYVWNGFQNVQNSRLFDAVWTADDDWSPSASGLYAELPRCKKYLHFTFIFVGLYSSNTKLMINLRDSSQTLKLCSSLLTGSYINNSISDCYAYKIDCLCLAK